MGSPDYLITNTATSAQTRVQRQPYAHNRGKRVLYVGDKRLDPARPLVLSRAEVEQNFDTLRRMEQEGLISCKIAGTQQPVSLAMGLEPPPSAFGLPPLLREKKTAEWGPLPFFNIPTPEGGFDWQPPKGWTSRSREEEEAAEAQRLHDTLTNQEPPLPPHVLPDLPAEVVSPDLGPPAMRGTPAPEAAAKLKETNPDFFNDDEEEPHG